MPSLKLVEQPHEAELINQIYSPSPKVHTPLSSKFFKNMSGVNIQSVNSLFRPPDLNSLESVRAMNTLHNLRNEIGG